MAHRLSLTTLRRLKLNTKINRPRPKTKGIKMEIWKKEDFKQLYIGQKPKRPMSKAVYQKKVDDGTLTQEEFDSMINFLDDLEEWSKLNFDVFVNKRHEIEGEWVLATGDRRSTLKSMLDHCDNYLRELRNPVRNEYPLPKPWHNPAGAWHHTNLGWELRERD